MDIEFHYYWTYLIARRAGFPHNEARTIAHSSQMVDDNSAMVKVSTGTGEGYRNYISQTMNITKPKRELLRVYSHFHFIPGKPDPSTTNRKDGKLHWLNTTPNSDNARLVFDRALATNNLYRIGIACHAFADTWAHQNFVGYHETFNAMATPLGKILPDIGHADAAHEPDWPGLVWEDVRLKDERVDNRARFLEAACTIFELLIAHRSPEVHAPAIRSAADELRELLDDAVGDPDPENAYVEERVKRYEARAVDFDGGEPLPKYDADAWLNAAVDEEVVGLQNRTYTFDPFEDKLTWKDPRTYRATDWYRFQEAVKAHQNETWAILEGPVFSHLDLPSL